MKKLILSFWDEEKEEYVIDRINYENQRTLLLGCGYELPEIDFYPYAAIIDVHKKVKWLRTNTYKSQGKEKEFFPNAKVIFDFNNRGSNRLKTGDKIRRVPIKENQTEEIYEDINELRRLYKRAKNPEKIYQAIGSNRAMYGYRWEYIKKEDKQTKLWENI